MTVSDVLARVFRRGKAPLPHLDYNVTEHCNLTCVGCDHDSPAAPAKMVDVEVFRKDLIAFRDVGRVRELRILGGEPLLHNKLVELLQIARSVGLADKVVVFTNGVLLGRAPEGFFDEVDVLYISKYPGVTVGLPLEELVRKSRQHKFKLHVLNGDTFVERLIDVEITDKERVANIYKTCTIAKNCHTLHEGRFYKCSVAPFFERRLGKLGQAIPEDTIRDSIAIPGDGDTAGRVDAYLKNTTPLAACRWCLGSTGEEMPNTQARARPLQRRADNFEPPRFSRARHQAARIVARARRAMR